MNIELLISLLAGLFGTAFPTILVLFFLPEKLKFYKSKQNKEKFEKMYREFLNLVFLNFLLISFFVQMFYELGHRSRNFLVELLFLLCLCGGALFVSIKAEYSPQLDKLTIPLKNRIELYFCIPFSFPITVGTTIFCILLAMLCDPFLISFVPALLLMSKLFGKYFEKSF